MNDLLKRGEIVAIYKPKGPSSFAMVGKIRKITGEKKVGHAGTLDPLASGVLVVAIGREATKKLAQEVSKEKEYLATIKFGLVSSTDDEEGQKENVSDAVKSLADIKTILKKFQGEISQKPPIYSAIKYQGQRAYKLARSGSIVELKSRPALIKEIEIIEYNWPVVVIRVVTGPGVYVRALARDIGEQVGTGAYLADLIRTRVGEFTIDHAINLN